MTSALSPAPFDAARFADFLRLHHLPARAEASSPDEYWSSLTWEEREETGLDLEALDARYADFLSLDGQTAGERALRSLEILRGRDKSGNPERYDLRFVPGDVVCLVGPTGAGRAACWPTSSASPSATRRPAARCSSMASRPVTPSASPGKAGWSRRFRRI